MLIELRAAKEEAEAEDARLTERWKWIDPLSPHHPRATQFNFHFSWHIARFTTHPTRLCVCVCGLCLR